MSMEEVEEFVDQRAPESLANRRSRRKNIPGKKTSTVEGLVLVRQKKQTDKGVSAKPGLKAVILKRVGSSPARL